MGPARAEREWRKTSLPRPSPPFQEKRYRSGDLVRCKGKTYVVTRWEELPPTPLARGGSVPEWEIWGRMVSDEVTGTAVHEEAERILRQSEDRRSGES